MELQYELSLDDLVAFNKYHIWHSPTCRRAYRWNLALTLGIVVIGLLIPTLSAKTDDSRLHLIIGLVIVLAPVALLVWLALHLHWRLSPARRVRKLLREGANKGSLGMHTLTFGQRGVTEISTVSEATWTWESFERIAEDKKHVYVYLGAVSAHVIPKRAFRDEQHMRAFLDEVRGLKAEADAAQEGPESSSFPSG